MNYLIIYQKKDNSVIYRTSKTKPKYSIKDETSMGWIVLDIQKLYKGKLYSQSEYDLLIANRMKLRDITTLLNKIDFLKMLEIMIVSVMMYMLIVK